MHTEELGMDCDFKFKIVLKEARSKPIPTRDVATFLRYWPSVLQATFEAQVRAQRRSFKDNRPDLNISTYAVRNGSLEFDCLINIDQAQLPLAALSIVSAESVFKYGKELIEVFKTLFKAKESGTKVIIKHNSGAVFAPIINAEKGSSVTITVDRSFPLAIEKARGPLLELVEPIRSGHIESATIASISDSSESIQISHQDVDVFLSDTEVEAEPIPLKVDIVKFDKETGRGNLRVLKHPDFNERRKYPFVALNETVARQCVEAMRNTQSSARILRETSNILVGEPKIVSLHLHSFDE